MYSTVKSMAERLVSAKLALTTALSDEFIKLTFAQLVFNQIRLDAGMAIYIKTEGLYWFQRTEYAQQYAATESFYILWEKAKGMMTKYLAVADFVLDDYPLLKKALGLHDGRKYSFAAWVIWARNFYATAINHPEISAKLAEFTVTAELLQVELDVMDQLEELNRIQKIEKAEAQQATKDRDEAFAQLDRYMHLFNKMARLLFVDRPQYLEKLGILERSVPIQKNKTEEPAQTEEPVDPGTGTEPPATETPIEA
ncbi:MAG: hypothetical protein GY940_41890 [bacterium]|nr:hypothetical protein [bacterium]